MKNSANGVIYFERKASSQAYGQSSLSKIGWHLSPAHTKMDLGARVSRKLEFVLDDRTRSHDGFPADGLLVGDAMRLQQVLVNLVGNAVKFTEEGTVRLLAEVDALKAPDVVIAVSIIDTGIGISEEQQARLFESFEQAESSTTRRFGRKPA